MKKTAKYLHSHPEAAKKKAAYDKKFNATPERLRYRRELARYNAKHGKVGDGKDASHKGGKIVGLEKESTNRGRKEKSRLKGSTRKKK